MYILLTTECICQVHMNFMIVWPEHIGGLSIPRWLLFVCMHRGLEKKPQLMLYTYYFANIIMVEGIDKNNTLNKKLKTSKIQNKVVSEKVHNSLIMYKCTQQNNYGLSYISWPYGKRAKFPKWVHSLGKNHLYPENTLMDNAASNTMLQWLILVYLV